MAESKGCSVVVAAMVAILALVVGVAVGGGVVYYVFVFNAPEPQATAPSGNETTPTAAPAGEDRYAVLYPLEQTLRVEGALDPKEVKDEVLGKRFELRKCYQQALEDDPDLKGEMSLQFTVAGSNGRVTAAVERHTKFPSKSVKKCMLDEIKSWQFSGDRNDESVVKFDVLMLSMSASEAAP